MTPLVPSAHRSLFTRSRDSDREGDLFGLTTSFFTRSRDGDRARACAGGLPHARGRDLDRLRDLSGEVFADRGKYLTFLGLTDLLGERDGV